jgi:D-beta-D-heptose 7-phosphate kinase/D-beta-D-heptose 1-phosphate adenosyltransferase
MHSQLIAEAIRSGFDHKRVLVVGDLMLDRYMWGDVSRVSPEAPVPVLRPQRDAERAGGAGNLALNLAALGLRVQLAGYVGDDQEAQRLFRFFEDAGVGTDLVATLSDRPTITKTRIIASHQHVLRVDAEDLSPLRESDAENFSQRLLAELDNSDAIALSDYGKRVLGDELCKNLIAEARRRGLTVVVDPKGRSYRKYAGATVLTPNLKELETATGVSAYDHDALIETGRRLVKDLGLDAIVLTQGEHGMTLIAPEQTLHSPARAKEVFDVSGAGDTVVAALTAGMLAGLDRTDVLRLANLAAGVVVGKIGTAPVERNELLEALHPHGAYVIDSIYTPKRLQRAVAGWRANGNRIVFTNGCFDLLHAGHVDYLQKAADEGERLIVALNTDRSVRALKGEGRPIVTQEDRAYLIAALAAVDAVTLFDEETPMALINALRPDVLVKGADYTEDRVVGAKEVRSWGGDVVLVPLVEGKSTSELIRKITGL